MSLPNAFGLRNMGLLGIAGGRGGRGGVLRSSPRLPFILPYSKAAAQHLLFPFCVVAELRCSAAVCPLSFVSSTLSIPRGLFCPAEVVLVHSLDSVSYCGHSRSVALLYGGVRHRTYPRAHSSSSATAVFGVLWVRCSRRPNRRRPHELSEDESKAQTPVPWCRRVEVDSRETENRNGDWNKMSVFILASSRKCFPCSSLPVGPISATTFGVGFGFNLGPYSPPPLRAAS